MKKILFSTFILTQFIFSSAPDWDNQFDSSGYAYSMSMTVIIEDEAGNYVAEENEDMLAAFDSSGNIRGVGFEAFVPFNIGDYGHEKLFMIQIFSNSISGEEIRFKFYDTSEDHIYTISNETTVIFNDQTYPGSFTSPHHLIIQSGSCPSSMWGSPEFLCMGGGVCIDGDSALNAWAAAYGDCPSYTLSRLSITNLDNTTSIENIFSGLKSIPIGNLSIANANQLTSINDFENLVFVGNKVDIVNVNNLTSIKGLGERGIDVYSFGLINAPSISNCSDIPLFNCNMTILSRDIDTGNHNCEYFNVIGCDGSCEPVWSDDLVLNDCAGNCGGSSYWVNPEFCWNVSDESMECGENSSMPSCHPSMYESCLCRSGTSDDGNICPQSCQDDSFALGAASIDITSDNQASYDAGIASVTPEDGITQETVDAAVEVAAMEAYILGAQSGDINNSGFLNVTDIIMYVEKILTD